MATTTVTVNVAESQNYLATSKTISVESATKQQGYITLSSYSVNLVGDTTTVTILTSSGNSYSVASSSTAVATASVSGTTITITGKKTGSATITVTVDETSTYTAASAQIALTVTYIKPQAIYGISFTESSSYVTISYTDDAVGMTPATADLNGTGGSSAFDNIEPWKSCKQAMWDASDIKGATGTYAYGARLWRCPKFWYKITLSSSGSLQKLQIANYPADGFEVSPAHRDRGWGSHDYVYAMHYPLSSPITSNVKSNVRSYFNRNYSSYSHFEDLPFAWTVRMLFMVEFKSIAPETVIGVQDYSQNYGAGSMPTQRSGTTASSRSSSGITYYRGLISPFPRLSATLDGAVAKYRDSGDSDLMYIVNNITDYSSLDDTASNVYSWINNNPSKVTQAGQLDDTSYSLTANGTYIVKWQTITGSFGTLLKKKDGNFNTINTMYHSKTRVTGISSSIKSTGVALGTYETTGNLDFYSLYADSSNYTRICAPVFSIEGSSKYVVRGIFYSND